LVFKRIITLVTYDQKTWDVFIWVLRSDIKCHRKPKHNLWQREQVGATTQRPSITQWCVPAKKRQWAHTNYALFLSSLLFLSHIRSQEKTTGRYLLTMIMVIRTLFAYMRENDEQRNNITHSKRVTFFSLHFTFTSVWVWNLVSHQGNNTEQSLKPSANYMYHLL
jgi:hypothetical protein